MRKVFERASMWVAVALVGIFAGAQLYLSVSSSLALRGVVGRAGLAGCFERRENHNADMGCSFQSEQVC